MFVLDTDHLSVLQWEQSDRYTYLMKRLEHQPRDRIYVTIVSFHEQLMGWHNFIHRAKRPEQVVHGYREFSGLITDYEAMQILEFDENAAAKFAELRSQRVRIGTMDLRIAAIALGHDFTVLTSNAADYARVPDLRLEDWTLPLDETDS